MALNLIEFGTRPTRGGWLVWHRACERARTLRTVEAVEAWQHDHTCDPRRVAQVTKETAQRLLQGLPRDPLSEVEARRRALVGS